MFTESSIGVEKGGKGRELQVDPRLREGDHVHVENREIYSIPTVFWREGAQRPWSATKETVGIIVACGNKVRVVVLDKRIG
jgi:hypothetical protein